MKERNALVQISHLTFLYSPGLAVRPGQARRGQASWFWSDCGKFHPVRWCWWSPLCSSPEPTELTPAPSTNERAHPRRTPPPPSRPSLHEQPPRTSHVATNRCLPYDHPRIHFGSKICEIINCQHLPDNEAKPKTLGRNPLRRPGRWGGGSGPSRPCAPRPAPCALARAPGASVQDAPSLGGGSLGAGLFVFPRKNANQSRTRTQQTNKRNTPSWLCARGVAEEGSLKGSFVARGVFLKGDSNGCFMGKWQDGHLVTSPPRWSRGPPGSLRQENTPAG